MPTSDRGSDATRRARGPHTASLIAAGGFTLIELLVVITIIAIASAGVSFAIRDGTQSALEREGDRLALLLETARAQSRTLGEPLRWEATAQGFRFQGPGTSAMPTTWLNAPVEVRWDGATPQQALVLGPEPIIDARSITIARDGRLLRLGTDGLRPFRISPP
jgi:general secretion pathway protein H